MLMNLWYIFLLFYSSPGEVGFSGLTGRKGMKVSQCSHD